MSLSHGVISISDIVSSVGKRWQSWRRAESGPMILIGGIGRGIITPEVLEPAHASLLRTGVRSHERLFAQRLKSSSQQ